jgi:hypothetical protein
MKKTFVVSQAPVALLLASLLISCDAKPANEYSRCAKTLNDAEKAFRTAALRGGKKAMQGPNAAARKAFSDAESELRTQESKWAPRRDYTKAKALLMTAEKQANEVIAECSRTITITAIISSSRGVPLSGRNFMLHPVTHKDGTLQISFVFNDDSTIANPSAATDSQGHLELNVHPSFVSSTDYYTIVGDDSGPLTAANGMPVELNFNMNKGAKPRQASVDLGKITFGE